VKKGILFLVFTFNFLLSFGQTAPDEYYFLVEKAGFLYKAKDYRNSALTYSSAFKTFGWKGYLDDRYNAACAWAKAGVPDSAFFNLERIAEKANYSDYDQLTSDSDLISLHSDRRWQHLLKLVSVNKEKSKGSNKILNHFLDSLVKEDQKWRNYMTRFNNHELSVDTISKEEIIHNIVLTDSLNYFHAKEIFEKYGFPNYDLVGEKGSNNFWLIMQHQDMHPEFQDSVLSKMKTEVDVNKASASNFAYLTDRVKVNTKQLQVYGTQMQLNEDSTSFEPKPVIEPEKLNERRKSVGLGSIEDYTEAMNNRYFGSLKKK
jgi:hypothetical protein